MLRDQPHHAGVAEQVGTDLAFLEVAQEDYVDAAWRKPKRIVFVCTANRWPCLLG